MKKSRFEVICEYNYYRPLREEDEEVNPDASQNEIGDDTPDDNLEDGDDLDDIGTTLDDEFGLDGDDAPTEDGDDLDDIGDSGDEVELDVTDIVDGVNKNSEAIENIDSKLDNFSSELNKLLNTIEKTNNSLAKQIKSSEDIFKAEMQKRIPTANEKIRMQSLSTFPFNVRLDDYFKPAGKPEEYKHSISNPSIKSDENKEEEPEEYTIHDGEFDGDFYDIKDTL